MIISEPKIAKHLKINERNYQLNKESNYTEKIQELDKNFDYSQNKNNYWSKPELSLFYGSPLYEQASESQKMALNHLYWAVMYEYIAASEGSTILYNDVTAGVFQSISGYDTLCESLALESIQERSHIHIFQKISYQTKLNILGSKALKFSFKSKSQGNSLQKWQGYRFKKLQDLLRLDKFASQLNFSSDKIYCYLLQTLFRQNFNYSLYLKDLESKNRLPYTPVNGYFAVAFSEPLLRLFTFAWGSSPFLACHHYNYRFTGNMGLKVYEYDYVQYYRQLKSQGEFIPTPTLVSYYHFMDEAFHTSTSQLIGRDMHEDFQNVTSSEKLLANLQTYTMQKGFLSSLSGALPAVYRGDETFMFLYYRVLRSDLFNFSHQDAIYWLNKCLCCEHLGFQVNQQYHQSLLSDLLRLFGNLEYLWKVNRELEVMVKSNSINEAIKNNIQALQRFSQLTANEK